MRNRQRFSIESLPDVLLSDVLSRLAPEEICSTALMNRRFKRIAYDRRIWAKKHEEHFPSALYQPDPRFAQLSSKPMGWYNQFRNSYRTLYKGLSKQGIELFYLVKTGNIDEIRKKKITLADWNNVKDRNGESLLDWAQQLKKTEILNYVYRSALAAYTAEGEDAPNTQLVGQQQMTILSWSIMCLQDSNTVLLLLQDGSRLTERYRDGRSPLSLAISANNLTAVQVFAEFNEQIFREEMHYLVDGLHPLAQAICEGRLSLVEYLLQFAGAVINLGTRAVINLGTTRVLDETKGYTALHWAASNGFNNIVERLISANAILTQPANNESKSLPIHLAAQKGHHEVAEILVRSNASLADVPNALGMNPLMLAADRGHGNVMNVLIRAGAEIPVDPYHNKTEIIHLAAERGHLSVVQVVIENNPECLNKIDERGSTPLHRALLTGRLDVVRYLSQQGAVLQCSKSRDKRSLNEESFKKESLSKESQSQLALFEYISRRSKQPEYKKSFTLFGHTFNFGFSKQQKLAAANALKEVVFNGADKASLGRYQKELNNGELKSVYRGLSRR